MVPPGESSESCPVEIENELSIVEREMRRRGYRWTAQRQLIARVALSDHSHYSADELMELCRSHDARVSRATVYRTLAMLEDAGFVEGLDTGDGGRKFEHTLGHDHHDHMVCTQCGSITEFRDPELEQRQEAAAARHGFEIQSHSLKLFGRCRDCRSR
ncbi:MAG: transcriptional repressor [Planctomycetes bacterium]|nr:transcriptional repressor [Planctomycetota bacterium]